MITEIAEIAIKPGFETAFEAAVQQATNLFLASRGCRGLTLQRGIERPNHYVLMVRWDSVEDHMVTFRQSAAFVRWRGLVGDHFAEIPQIRHVRTVIGAE